MQLFDGYVNHLSSIECVILATVIKQIGQPRQLYNNIINHLKVLANTTSPSMLPMDVMLLLSKLGIANKSHAALNTLQFDTLQDKDDIISHTKTMAIINRSYSDGTQKAHLDHVLIVSTIIFLIETDLLASLIFTCIPCQQGSMLTNMKS